MDGRIFNLSPEQSKVDTVVVLISILDTYGRLNGKTANNSDEKN